MYHITCRGNHQEDIYRDDEDRQFYLKTLRQVQKRYPYILHSYCLMTNHVHLQIETTDIDIRHVMKRINMVYAIYFNKRYSIVGHLFQDRFNSQLIDSDRYVLELSRYIHLNPVRAGMGDRPLDYPWSSYAQYVRRTPNTPNHLVFTDKILSYFSHPQAEGYKNYVERELSETEGGIAL